MIVYRLCKAEYAADLSGSGARKSGGRWNSKGVPMVYAAASRALCTAELAVHLPLGIMPKGYNMVSIEVPGNIRIGELNDDQLPPDWKSFPYHSQSQKIGDKFIADSLFAVMKVPSAVIPGEFNYLINPDHKDFPAIKIKSSEAFDWDERLFMR